MDAKIFSHEGVTTGTIALPPSLFAVPWNDDMMYEVVIGMQANARAGTAHTQGRGEVRGGGKKPWKQKGTGRARHGSTRSPIWTGGGVSHGPRAEKDYSVKINKKVRAKALASVLTRKMTDGEVIFLDSFNLETPKTTTAKAIIGALAKGAEQASLATKRKNAALIMLPRRHEATEKSFSNLGHITVMQAKDVNPVDLLTYKYVVVAEPSSSLEVLEKRMKTTTPKTK